MILKSVDSLRSCSHALFRKVHQLLKVNNEVLEHKGSQVSNAWLFLRYLMVSAMHRAILKYDVLGYTRSR